MRIIINVSLIQNEKSIAQKMYYLLTGFPNLRKNLNQFSSSKPLNILRSQGNKTQKITCGIFFSKKEPHVLSLLISSAILYPFTFL